jgi:hypothetical protein
MSHLPTERLAAFVNEPPSATEMAHLAACAECARERALYRSLAELAASESSRIGEPLTSWDKLKPALVADGVIDDGRGVPFGSRHMRRPWLQAAAAVLLIAGGVMAGRRSAGASLFPARHARRSLCRRRSIRRRASSRSPRRVRAALAARLPECDGLPWRSATRRVRQTVRRPCARVSPRSIARARSSARRSMTRRPTR